MNFTNILARILLHLMAAIYNRRSSMREYLKSDKGWINFTIGIRIEDGSIGSAVRFRYGKGCSMHRFAIPV
ncbi:MAG: hypothetical protein A2176_07950 [Spirochaetes bacterium RBG_13_51_14]|nr:MAG: hypothetical protein A2176_07950 [Spirochaetes bacterium RBG_13_51_14]